MPSIPSLIQKISSDFPQFSFVAGDDFHWSHQDQTVTYRPDGSVEELLHELGHATLAHTDYSRDIELLEIERAAWSAAQTVALRYQITIDDDILQDALDTYRDWLHARSTCPTCRATGLEIKKHLYHCPACRGEWRVNEARICALRRRTLK